MAKFDEMSPTAIRGTRVILSNGDEVAKVSDGKTHPCWHCEDGTDWADFFFEAFLCSEECLSEKTKEYGECLEKLEDHVGYDGSFGGHYSHPLTEAE